MNPEVQNGEFKYPMKKLNLTETFWAGTKTNGETNNIKETNVFWKNENDIFVLVRRINISSKNISWYGSA